MTTQQFYEMPLACNLTMNELLDIKDALFEAEKMYRQKDMPNIAKTLDKLYIKFNTIEEQYEELLK